MALTSSTIYTLGDVARKHGIQLWQVRRLYERGLLPPAQRVGHARVIHLEELSAVEAALRKAGYLPEVCDAAS